MFRLYNCIGVQSEKKNVQMVGNRQQYFINSNLSSIRTRLLFGEEMSLVPVSRRPPLMLNDRQNDDAMFQSMMLPGFPLGLGSDLNPSFFGPLTRTRVEMQGNDRIIHIKLPGMRKEDVHVSVQPERILLRAQHKTRTRGVESYRSISKTFPLPKNYVHKILSTDSPRAMDTIPEVQWNERHHSLTIRLPDAGPDPMMELYQQQTLPSHSRQRPMLTSNDNKNTLKIEEITDSPA